MNMNENKKLPPNEWVTPVLNERPNIKRHKKCGFCGIIGHNKRSCIDFLNQGTILMVVTDVVDQNT